MKIILATAFPADPGQPRGGVEAVSVILAEALSRHSALDVHVVTADPSCGTPRQYQWNAVAVHRLPWPADRMLTGALGAAGASVRNYVQQLGPAVVHAHDTYGLMVDRLSAPRVMTIHGFIHADTAISGERWAGIRARAWRRAEHRAWSRFPHLISISPYVRERLTGIATGTIHDIDNPTGRVFFDVPRRETGLVIFCAASITPRKNIVALVEAFALVRARCPRATLRVAGPAPVAGYLARVHDRVHALGLDESVSILPALGTTEVRDELASASVFALLSLEENAPLAVQEAMAVGVPVVTSNRCGMPYQVQDGETGFLVDPRDTATVADRLIELVEDGTARAAMGARARLVAQARFHPDAVARRTRRVYELAAGARVSASSASRSA